MNKNSGIITNIILTLFIFWGGWVSYSILSNPIKKESKHINKTSSQQNTTPQCIAFVTNTENEKAADNIISDIPSWEESFFSKDVPKNNTYSIIIKENILNLKKINIHENYLKNLSGQDVALLSNKLEAHKTQYSLLNKSQIVYIFYNTKDLEYQLSLIKSSINNSSIFSNIECN